MKTWRFIEHKPSSGFFNMAVDEALLDSYIAENTKPVLRLYKWNKPTLSIGRNQKLSEINIEKCLELDIDIVRRQTGGKAVLHQGEITYSFISGKKDGMSDNIFDSYFEISKALILSLEKLNNSISLSIGESPATDYTKNAFCFASSTVSDLNYLGKKFVGSAQLRRGNAFLQHGSILINQDFSILNKLFISQQNTTNLINLQDILGFIPDYDMIKECIQEGFKEFFNIDLTHDSLSNSETSLSEIYCLKYKNL